MTRMKLIQWKNKRSGWTRRFILFAAGPHGEDRWRNIRIQLEDTERLINVYPSTKEEAERIMNEFQEEN